MNAFDKIRLVGAQRAAGAQLPEPPPAGIPLSGTPQTGAPSQSPPHTAQRPPKIRRAVLVQDGHSLGEQALYDALWKASAPAGDESRIVTAGYRQMSDMSRMTVNNCKANAASLIQKLAMEEVNANSYTTGRTYRIFAFSTILQRRREAGLLFYIKSKGVTFVDPETGETMTKRGRTVPQRGVPFSGAPASSAPASGEKGAPALGVEGAPLSDSHLNRNLVGKEEEVPLCQKCAGSGYVLTVKVTRGTGQQVRVACGCQR